MNTTVSAVYEQGALRLFTPLTLPESTNVKVQIWSNKTYPQRASHRRIAAIRDLLTQVVKEWSNAEVHHIIGRT